MLIGLTNVQAQSDGNSPFSRLGIGDLHDSNFIPISLLGGLAASYRDPYKVNIANPAALGHLRATAFEFAVFGRRNSLSEQDNRDNFWEGNIGYISLAFPIINPINELIENKQSKIKWGAQIALQPFSRVSYNISSAQFDPDIGTIKQDFKGNGNTFKLSMNHGFRWDKTAFGLSTGLLLGSIDIENSIRPSDEQGARIAQNNGRYSVSGFLWNFGVMHDFEFMDEESKKNLADIRIPRLTIGATIHSNTSFNSKTDIQVLSLGRLSLDTIFAENGQLGDGTLPMELNIGLMYNSGKNWTLGANYYYSKWTDYDNDGQKALNGVEELTPLSDSWKVSIGGSIVPNPNSIRNLFSRSKYLLGAYYLNDPRKFGKTQLKQYAVTTGIELPFIKPRNFSFITLGVELGRQEVKDALTNNYFKINLGLTFNSNQWFIKRKYN